MWPVVPAGVVRETWPLAPSPCSVLPHLPYWTLNGFVPGAWGWVCTACPKTSESEAPCPQSVERIMHLLRACDTPVTPGAGDTDDCSYTPAPLHLRLTRKVICAFQKHFAGARRLTVPQFEFSYSKPRPECLSPASKVQF